MPAAMRLLGRDLPRAAGGGGQHMRWTCSTRVLSPALSHKYQLLRHSASIRHQKHRPTIY
eukprot:6200926-Pleurochrysis_carterae.AAC.5